MEIIKSHIKQFNKIALRKIEVAHQTFLWKRGHLHLQGLKFEELEPTCIEKVVIYLEKNKQSPLVLYFRECDNTLIESFQHKTEPEQNKKWCVGYPDDGVIWLSQPPYPNNHQSIHINVNRPAVIAALIKYFSAHGWKPETANTPFVEEHALKFLQVIDLPHGIQ